MLSEIDLLEPSENNKQVLSAQGALSATTEKYKHWLTETPSLSLNNIVAKRAWLAKPYSPTES